MKIERLDEENAYNHWIGNVYVYPIEPNKHWMVIKIERGIVHFLTKECQPADCHQQTLFDDLLSGDCLEIKEQ